MSETLGQCCISGVSHTGTPKGELKTIGGTPAYVATPSGTYDKTKVLLLLPDVFGLELLNAKLLSDDFAANGIYTVLVDYLVGDPIPADALNPDASTPFDLMAWVGQHGESVTRPPLDSLIAGLKAQGVKDFAATGYCFGGKWTAQLVQEKIVKVGVVSHPSLLAIPDDLIKIQKAALPMLWVTCETDFMYGPEKQAIADETFKGDKNYKRTYYPGVGHGFAVRGDMSDPNQKAAKEGAFKDAVEYVKLHL